MSLKFKQSIYVLAIVAVAFFSCTNDKQNEATDSSSRVKSSINLLTIGNSFAENALEYLDEITESVPGYEINISRANIGGASLQKHADLIAACEKDSTLKPYRDGTATLEEILTEKNYDIITIQQVSASSFKPEDYHPYTEILIDFIKEHAPSAEIMIHQTWAYSPICPRLKEFGITRDEMHTRLVKCYNDLAERTKFRLLLSGNAYYLSYKENSNVYLWNDDGYHALDTGEYLSGCVWFGTIFNVSPEKIKYVPEVVEPETAEFLRKIAAKVVNIYSKQK